MDDRKRALAARLRTALDLHRFGVRMMRQNLRRHHPEASEDEIGAMLSDWMRQRPPDCPGPERRLA